MTILGKILGSSIVVVPSDSPCVVTVSELDVLNEVIAANKATPGLVVSSMWATLGEEIQATYQKVLDARASKA